jgi:hypothetical protein
MLNMASYILAMAGAPADVFIGAGAALLLAAGSPPCSAAVTAMPQNRQG